MTNKIIDEAVKRFHNKWEMHWFSVSPGSLKLIREDLEKELQTAIIKTRREERHLFLNTEDEESLCQWCLLRGPTLSPEENKRNMVEFERAKKMLTPFIATKTRESMVEVIKEKAGDWWAEWMALRNQNLEGPSYQTEDTGLSFGELCAKRLNSTFTSSDTK